MRKQFLFNYSLNFISAILLIYLSKWLLRQYSISSLTLTIFNCFISGICATFTLHCVSWVPTSNTINSSKVTFRMLLVSGSFAVFLIYSNLSLQHNTLGTYQLIKLQVPPMLTLIEWIQLRFHWNSPLMTEEKFRRDYSPLVLISFGIIVIGTLVNTYSDLNFHLVGIFYAVISVLCNALYQALVQGDQAVSLNERMHFLKIQSFTSAILLLPGILFLDSSSSSSKFVSIEINRNLWIQWDLLFLLFACGLLAFIVNSSVIWCIKDDAAIGFNMVGQLKTLLIVFLGSALFDELLTIRQIISIGFTTAGCMMYVYITYRTKECQKIQYQSPINNL